VSTTTQADRSTSRPRVVSASARRLRLGPWDILVLSAWCGLAGGLLEVATRVLCKYVDPTNRLYMLSRHFVWLAPLSTLLLFAGAGLFLVIGTKLWPRRVAWFCPRFICFWAVLPALMVASPGIYLAAWVVLAVGIASLLAQLLERHVTGLRHWLLWTFPALLASVLILATLVVGEDWLKEWREASRPLPPVSSPNVLLVVMDTVRADRLSVYGYERPTTPVLERLAKRGIRFDNARATAPWTLASHASFFSGRWPHELGVEWLTPLRGNFPTLSEYLGSRGYATAGFVANTLYCSHETGLDRGFTYYEDYILEGLMPLRMAWLVDHLMQTVSDWGTYVGRTFNVGPFRPMQDSWIAPFFVVNGRKDADSINRGFMNWLARRRQPARPFFAFLNFFDAHAHYVLPRGAEYRFGVKPRRTADFIFLIEYWDSVDKRSLRPIYRRLAQDSYDNCVAYLDERMGELFDGLQKRGLLDNTLVIVTADHGEGLGEHDLFDHGESLYRNEIRVPLLIVLPTRKQCQGVVDDTVSLRDLPATIVDLVGLGDGAPFSGRSLAHLWRNSSSRQGAGKVEGALSELRRPNPFNPNQGRSPAHRGSLVSLADGDFVYIRNEGDGTEEIFNERDDPGELRNLAHDAATQPILERFRRGLHQMKANPPQGMQ
jgi:arylsulfatase A-like enzyme